MVNILGDAKIRDRGVITIPKEVRKALNLQEGETICFKVQSDGKVTLCKPKYEDITVK